MGDMEVQFGTADLTTCDREIIHTPGSVQPYGAMLVIDAETLTILQAGGATQGLLCKSVSALAECNLADIMSLEKIRRLNQLLFENELRRPMHLLNFMENAEHLMLDVSVHQNEGGLVFEFEESEVAENAEHNPLGQVQAMIASISEASSLDHLCQYATNQLQRATGYDRVMVYRFLPDDSGSVVAETVNEGHARFFGLRYPASDIPQQARVLYLTNWLRIVADVDAVPSPLMPHINPLTRLPLDMSHATLRSVSPIHLEYLRNMGVQATMTISIIKNGKLWGLIACHHHSPKRLPRHLRAVCELFGTMFALQLDARERAEAMEYRHKSSKVHSALVNRMSGHDDLASGLIDQTPTLLDYLDSDGVAILVDDKYTAIGRTPRESQVRALVAWLDKHAVDGIFASNNLSAQFDLAKDFAIEASGVLAISASRSPSDYIIWFRPELIESVRWAGDPNKPVEVGPHGDRLNPRKSFEEWVQSVRYEAKPWTDNEIEAATQMRVSLLEVVLRRIDQVARERGIAQGRHETMVAELNHRVKNTLATIQALARYTHKSANSLKSYVTDFDRRIQAMATSHNLLSEAAWEKTDLRTLIAAQLEPYGSIENIVLDGPDVSMLILGSVPLGMVLHELATNAAKYGALSTTGQVRVEWNVASVQGERQLAIKWREKGGPRVVKPVREGFGTFTLNNIIPFQCGGQTSIRYAPGGVECDIHLGADCFAGQVEHNVSADHQAAHAANETQLSDTIRVLVVEDEAMIAFMIEQIVMEAGYEVVGPVSRLDAAIKVAASQKLSAALIDVNLAGDLTWPLARLLKERGVPFTFMTGYARAGVLNDEFSDALVLGKPFSANDMLAALARMISETQTA